MAIQIDNDVKVVGENRMGFGQNQILSTSTGRLYTGHINLSGYLEIHYSDDSGASWTLNYTSTEVIDSNVFSLCKSELDDIFVCFWTGYDSTTRNIYVKKRDHTSGTWSAVLSTTMVTGIASRRANVMCHYNRNINRLYMIYSYSNSNISLAGQYSDDKGTTWSGNINITTILTSGSQKDVDIWGIDSNILNGQLSIYWGANDNSYLSSRREIVSTALVQAGSDSGIAVTIYGGGMCVDSSGNYYVLAYQYTTTPNWSLKVKRNNASDTVLQTYGATDTLKYGMFSIGCDSSDNIYVFYTKKIDGKAYFMMRTASSGTWGTEQALTSATTGSRVYCEQHSKPGSNRLQIVYTSNA